MDDAPPVFAVKASPSAAARASGEKLRNFIPVWANLSVAVSSSSSCAKVNEHKKDRTSTGIILNVCSFFIIYPF
ncbi:hypothetical protein MGWOODY_Mmi1924 [hydrothermal vent metagenome]|uniref:Uncharacterized protein n=1 Tax=hydrothermal vent metagenome TaxID=652676 RepID=A0A160VEZ0_9ZZZZ